MKLEEVIRHLDDCMSETDKILWPECDEAHKLGVEGLKLIKRLRRKGILGEYELMPGETEE